MVQNLSFESWRRNMHKQEYDSLFLYRGSKRMFTPLLSLAFILMASITVRGQTKINCDTSCGGSDPTSPDMVSIRTAPGTTRGFGSPIRPVVHPTSSTTVSYPNPVLAKTVAVVGSQSFS